MRLHIHVVTVSDRVSRGEAADASGPAIINYLTDAAKCPGFVDSFSDKRVSMQTVPDDIPAIQAAVTSAAAAHKTGSNNNNNSNEEQEACLIVTTGGTGFAPRDVTPEAVEPLLAKRAQSIVQVMLAHCTSKYTPVAWLSRAVAGVVAGSCCLVVTLPGSPKAVVECLEAVVSDKTSGLAHALKLLVDPRDSHPTASSSATGSQQTATAALSACASAAVADRSRKSDFPMITVDAALKLIVDNTPLAPNINSAATPLSSAVGCVLAKDAVANFPQPPFRASIKDGYAVIAADGCGIFPVARSFCAGADIEAATASGYVMKPGTVCRVNTGGPLPDGADSVIQVEDTELVERTADGKEEAKIKVNIPAGKVGQDIRPVGCDVQKGAVVVPRGTELTAAEVALLSSMGTVRVETVTKPRIAILSTGDELVDSAVRNANGSPPPAGRIYDSNRPMLLKAAEGYGSAIIDLGIARDVHGETKAALDRGFACADIIISTGGVSMGEVDWVKKCLIDSGADVHFGRVAMKPGKPTTFASKGGKLFFALPGNPVSAMVCFYLFVVPALRKWAGFSLCAPASAPDRGLHLPQALCKTLEPLKPDSERIEYHRCKLGFEPGSATMVASSTGVQASHRLLSMAGANGLLIIPPGKEPVPAGSLLPVMIVGPFAA